MQYFLQCWNRFFSKKKLIHIFKVGTEQEFKNLQNTSLNDKNIRVPQIFSAILSTVYRHHRPLGISKEVQYISVPQGATKL